MSAEAFRQCERGAAHDLRLEALPCGIGLQSITSPVDVWHGRDDTIVRGEQAGILAAAIPDARRHFRVGHGHFSLVFTRPPATSSPSAPERELHPGGPMPTVLTRTTLELTRRRSAGSSRA
jgi:hypothetical protein